ncbi:MAG TPA: sigma-54 dependent transcriptional regulator [Bryobacteraceae bacterium]|nr:sigma-54 dependent transcriptional regulator [Bryobacteraceae bacterium]
MGNSPAMRKLHQLIPRMSKSRFPVLLQGETGTGKEVVAHAIHNLEGRGAFVVVDCSALVGLLMEAELFGHEKGAFTGALNQKLGLLDKANGGTAFFDEIGELPLDLQVKLLRVLQEKEFRPVGGLSPHTSNFRIIAATNRDLMKEVEAKRFRQDLYYRLNVMRLRLPPLREHKEDIPTLILHFLQRHGEGHRIPDDVMKLLCEYDWPGNVRELEQTVKAMVAMNSGPWVSVGDLPSIVVNRDWERRMDAKPGVEVSQDGKLTAEVIPLAELEKRAILHALQVTKGDRQLASDLLGIGRTTLYRKLKQYGL